MQNWPSFRGPSARGIADGFPLPLTWDVEKKQTLAWKTPLPGLGHSSPIVWDERVFVATAVSGAAKAELKVGLYGDIGSADDNGAQEWRLYCLDKKTGKVLWSQVAAKGVPQVKRHPKATHANTTLTTDGKHLVAFFGSEGLHCFDLEGKRLWNKDLGVQDSGYYQVPSAQWGFASSPLVAQGRVIVQADVQKNGFLACFNASDGSLRWLTPRSDVPTWGSPALCTAGGRAQIVVNGWKHIGGYDFATGKELWRLTGGGDIPVPTPVVEKGLIFITNAHGRQSPIYAIRPTATGNITLPEGTTTSPHIAWSQTRDGAYMQTPLVYGDYLYVCRDNGVLGCYEATTGKRVYQERLGTGRTGFTASAVAGDNKLYFTSEEGDVFVVQPGPTFKVLAQNTLGETCMATPALSEGRLYFHTREHLVAIGAR